jgi:predicted Zn-dependent peptidase
VTFHPPVTTGRQLAAGRLSSAQKVGGTRTVHSGEDGVVRRTLLPGGLRVITEQMPGVRSASIGVWVGVGSVDETIKQHGCSHFLEHLLFKGTTGRSAMDISATLDGVGGEFNAFTAKEYTCFHARVLDADVAMVIDVLGDMVTDSTLTPQDVEAERDVILDEIAMHEDDPDDVVHNLFAEQAWGNAPVGRNIAGTVASIGAMTRGQVLRFYRQHYRAPNMVVAVAGNVEHQAVVRAVETAFSRNGFLGGPELPVDVYARPHPRRVHPGVARLERPFEQANLVLGMQGLTRTDERRFVLGVLNAALGGGTSSRLFQEIREVRGLAYSVYSFASHHADAGLVGISVGCLPGKLEAVLDTVRSELAKIAADGITGLELVRAQGQIRGGIVLGLEDSGSRMSRLGKAELVYDELLSIDEVIARLEAVTLEQVRDLAAALFSGPEILAIVAPSGSSHHQ